MISARFYRLTQSLYTIAIGNANDRKRVQSFGKHCSGRLAHIIYFPCRFFSLRSVTFKTLESENNLAIEGVCDSSGTTNSVGFRHRLLQRKGYYHIPTSMSGRGRRLLLLGLIHHITSPDSGAGHADGNEAEKCLLHNYVQEGR